MGYSKNTQKKVALLLFSLSAPVESRRKRITKSAFCNKRIWQNLHFNAVSLVHSSGLDFFISDEKSQTGNNFGEKITYAIQSIFDQGYDQLIVIGNDCPELTQGHIFETTLHLLSKKLVVGQDKRGGAYLIGIDKSIFDSKTFLSLRWETTNFFNDLTGIVSADQTDILPTLSDFNEFSDIKFICRGKISYDLKKLLESATESTIEIRNILVPSTFWFSSTFYNKGSPTHS